MTDTLDILLIGVAVVSTLALVYVAARLVGRGFKDGTSDSIRKTLDTVRRERELRRKGE